MKKTKGELTIKEIVDLFVPKLWLIAIISVIFAAAFGIFTAMKTDTYTSVSTFMMVKVPQSNSESTNTGLNTGEIEAMQSMIQSSQYILESKTFCRSVREQLTGYDNVTPEQIRSMLSVSIIDDSTCFYISTVSTDPQMSKDIADIVHKLLPADIKERLPYAIEISTLDYPEAATSADSKNVLRNAVIGFALGFLLSVLAVFVFAKFDVIIRSREKIEENFDFPILGVIPRYENDV
ncbi:MAG: hypothetical protein IJX92_06135 [Clostridia bacterium]|nr:hypothetical protein [Clostridia bacterium]